MKNYNIINEVDAILFDIGGTLYKNKIFDNKIASQAEELLSEKLGLSIEMASEMMRNKMDELKVKEGDPSKVRAMADFGISKDEVHVAYSKVNPKDYLLPVVEISNILLKLKNKGLKLAVLSNFRIMLIQRILNALNIPNDVFDFIISEDMGFPIKPSLIPFQESVKLFKVDPKRILYVGDDFDKDMIPANKLGMRTIWINENNKGVNSTIIDLQLSDFKEMAQFI